ncbi:hypothetical protein E2I00_019961, partial [Balaenoptera physalus]
MAYVSYCYALALIPMLVDGSGVVLMCSIKLPGGEIQPPSQTLATVGACQKA